MWNSFQGALEKRVRHTGKKVPADSFIVIKQAKALLFSVFGKTGQENIEILSFDNGTLKLKCEKSIWRSELLLKRTDIIKQINSLIGQDEVKHIIVKS